MGGILGTLMGNPERQRSIWETESAIEMGTHSYQHFLCRQRTRPATKTEGLSIMPLAAATVQARRWPIRDCLLKVATGRGCKMRQGRTK
jgi:hypothetical protein